MVQGTPRTKYPYRKDHRSSHEISPPSQASSGQIEHSYHRVATLNCHPCYRVTSEVVSEWQCCPAGVLLWTEAESIVGHWGKLRASPKWPWDRDEELTAPEDLCYFFASGIFMHFKTYIQKPKISLYSTFFLLGCKRLRQKSCTLISGFCITALNRHTNSMSAHMMPSQTSLHYLTSPAQHHWWKTAKRKH